MLLSGFLAGLLLLSRLWAADSDDSLYIEVGGTAHLSPGSVRNPIRSITWKHGQDIAMEWFKGNTDAYRHFKDRGSLNSSTGVMTITKTIRNDSGIYTSEINGKVARKTQLLVVSPVSRPTVSIQCNEDMTSCVFTCEGSTTDAGPITYQWMSEEPIVTSTNELSITKEDKRPWFSCALHNPVSNETSDQVLNPFSLINDSDRNRNITAITLGTVLGFVILCICVFVICKRIKGKHGHMKVEGRKVGGAVEAVGYKKNPGCVSNENETSPLVSNGEATSKQEQPVEDQAADPQDKIQTQVPLRTPAASQDTNNLTVAEVHEATPNQEQPVEDQAADPQDKIQTPVQHLTPAASQDTNSAANQDPGCAVSHENTNETETSPLMSNGEATSKQEQPVEDQAADPQDKIQTQVPHLTRAASQDTNNLTVAEVHEATPNQEQPVEDQAADPQDKIQTPVQHLTRAASQDTNITANQDPGCAVSHENTNETETSPLMSNGEATSKQEQPVEDQAADPQDKIQTQVPLRTPAASQDTNITANQDPGCAVSHENTNETEKSAVSVSSDQEKPKDQKVDDQAAEPEVEDQS